jgi:formiminotetrahydrofolate cyclodeaminase
MADLYAAAALSRGTIDACYGMLCANLPSIGTPERAASLRSAFAAVRQEARELQDDLESRLTG